MPRCMESGAFEPVQQLPDGTFMCVDFNGEEVSRSNDQPECKEIMKINQKLRLSVTHNSIENFRSDPLSDGGVYR